jgi:hypothetical protein
VDLQSMLSRTLQGAPLRRCMLVTAITIYVIIDS